MTGELAASAAIRHDTRREDPDRPHRYQPRLDPKHIDDATDPCAVCAGSPALLIHLTDDPPAAPARVQRDEDRLMVRLPIPSVVRVALVSPDGDHLEAVAGDELALVSDRGAAILLVEWVEAAARQLREQYGP